MNDSAFLNDAPISTLYLKVICNHKVIPSNQIILSSDRRYIYKSNIPCDEIEVYYTLLAPELFGLKRRKPGELLKPANMPFTNPFAWQPGFDQNKDLIDKDGLDMKGSISRGLGFGNAQNLVVNSNLNLQINGKLNNDVDISAAVSDDNNPIQPEGNTQQLQDFDRVFIKLSKNKTAVTLGDFEMLKSPESYFMKYHKKSRGLQFSSGSQKGSRTFLTTGEGAISRGRFARNIVKVIEGNQGPYRLSGANNEVFIILIAGTEVIYLDGEKMTRGDQNDYTIDYNTGELTFTPKHLINRYSRVVAEFQYADRNYARSVFTFSQQATFSEKLNLHFNYFTEQDHKNQPFQRVLSDTDKYIMYEAGDRLEQAVIPTITSSEYFDKSQLLYVMRDTSVQGKSYKILKYISEQTGDSIYYRAVFNNVGVGNGNYIISKNAANGRVFEWIAPVNGKPSGSYEPYTQLTTPKRLQMAVMGGAYRIDTLTTIGAEFSGTQYNRNEFSDKDKENDLGYAFRGTFNKRSGLGRKKWNAQASYEQTDNNFRYIERYRPVEFDRIWNRNLQNTDRRDTGFAEKIGMGSVTLFPHPTLTINQQGAFYFRERIYSGIQEKSNVEWKYKNSILTGMYEYLEGKALNAFAQSNRVHQYRIQAVQGFRYMVIRGSRASETVRNQTLRTDSLSPGSYGYTEHTISLTNQDSGKTVYMLEYINRVDELPWQNKLEYASRGDHYGFKTEYHPEAGKRIALNGAWRRFQADSSRFSFKPENTLLFRLDGEWRFAERFITLTTFYQAGTGQELRRQFSYVEVQPGNGIYQWNDYNGDGVQQLNEFEIAVFRDKARYIKIFQPTTEYIQTRTLQSNQTLILNPASGNLIKNKFLRKFFLSTAIKTDRKMFQTTGGNKYNPYVDIFNDTALVSDNTFSRWALFFNRNSAIWGTDVSGTTNRNKQLLVNGLEGRSKTEYMWNIRWSIQSDYLLNASVAAGSKNYLSQFFTNRNFWYDYRQLNLKATIQPNNIWRLSIFLTSNRAANRPPFGNEKQSSDEGGLEFKYAFKENGSINVKISFNQINFNGDMNSPLAFDMLNGLQNGRNALWNINLQQKISKNIMMNIAYDGRKNETFKTIHIARVEARYLF